MMLRLAALASAVAVAGCGTDFDPDPGEGVGTLPGSDGPEVEFDPAAGVVPFPNDLLRDPTLGTLSLPPQCGESAAATATRVDVLNRLDGFATFASGIRFTFTEPPDLDSLRERFVLLRVSGPGIVSASMPQRVETELTPTVVVRYAADCATSRPVSAVIATPVSPLHEASTYVAAILRGVTAAGVELLPSVTWAMVRQSVNPVVVEDGAIISHRTPLDPFADAEQLLGIDLLWHAHHAGLFAVEQATHGRREDVLVATTFTTQTIIAPLDRAVDGSPAQRLRAVPPGGIQTLLVNPSTGTSITASEFLQAAIGIDAATCVALGCAAVADIIGASVTVDSYQTRLSNSLAGGDSLPGPWTDPRAPQVVRTESVDLVAVVPATPMPSGGYPVIFFGHGISRSKVDLFAIAAQLAGNGIAAVSIDWVDHGSRAIRISDDALDIGSDGLGCAGDVALLDPTGSHRHCFEPIFSANLAGVRDNLRQSALDAMAVIESIAACGTSECSNLKINPDRIGYLGQSLGAIIGGLVVAMSDRVKASVLNVGGAGLVDFIEQTDSLALRCLLVDALIGAGVLVGTPLDLTASPLPTGTCLDDAWRQQPGWAPFAAVARWVLDPADPANYGPRLAERDLLIQEVVADTVVPNSTTEQLARAAGLTAADARYADIAASATAMPSRAIASAGRQAWVLYETVPADVSASFVGNSFHHGSLLAPPTLTDCQETVTCADGQLGTARMQVDAIAFLRDRLGGI